MALSQTGRAGGSGLYAECLRRDGAGRPYGRQAMPRNPHGYWAFRHRLELEAILAWARAGEPVRPFVAEQRRWASIMTYAIHHYPTELIDVCWSRHGQRITVRPVLPQDAEPSQQFVRALSRRSRYRRFHGAINELTPDMLEQLTQVDYRRHLALVAEIHADDAAVLIGEARFAHDDEARRAEFALAVADPWQRQGVGTQLLQRLLRAAAMVGVRHLFGDIQHDNQPMLRLADGAGFTLDVHAEDEGLVRAAIDPSSAVRLPSGLSMVKRLASRLPLSSLVRHATHASD